MTQKYTPYECVADVLAAVNEKGDVTSRSLASHYKSSSEWLTDAIQTCKRKILEGTGLEFSEPKRSKPATFDKENVILNATDSVSNVEKLKKPVAPVKMEPASVKKAPVAAGAADPSYIPVMSLKVADLRNELRKRGLDSTGLKKELQQRLLEHVSDKRSGAVASKNAPKPAFSVDMRQESVTSDMPKTGEADIQMKDANSGHSDVKRGVEEMPTVNASSADSSAKSNTDDQGSSSRDREVLPEPSGKEKVVGKSFLKSTADLFSPSKIVSKLQSLTHQGDTPKPPTAVATEAQGKRSFAEGFKKTASAILSASPSGKSKPAHSSKSPFPKDSSQVEAVGAATQVSTMKAVGTASIDKQVQPEITSKVPIKPALAISIPAEPSKLSSAGAATKEKRVKCMEERSARLAEIRGKSKPVPGSKPAGASSDLPAVSASKLLKLGTAQSGKSDRKLLLTAQMREKAAASHKTQLSSNVPSTTKAKLPQIKEADAPEVAHSLAKITSSPKVVIPQLEREKPSVQTASAGHKLVRPTSVKKSMAQPADILSPMSTYEISDREHSDTDDSDSESEQKKSKKKLPKWAQKQNLLPALERQYADVDGRLDPDTIFPPVMTCNLEEIFDQKKTRYNRRTSSANWTKDGVSVNEIVAYKRTMGY